MVWLRNWDAVAPAPGQFAAEFPIPAPAVPSKASVLLNTPIWAHHAYADPVVPYQRSLAMFNAITAAASNAHVTNLMQLTTFTGNAPDGNAYGHNWETWSGAYQEPQFLPWMFAQHLTQQSPYLGTPWPIPGKLEAENYDTGGEGIAYHDTDTSNDGGQYRTSEGVDIEVCGDTGGGYDVGWTG